MFDEATGDVINATGSAELQLVIGDGRFRTFSTFTASGGELQGEVAVEVRISNSVALEVFYRRENDLLGSSGAGGARYGAYGTGIRDEREFTSWRSVLRGLLGRGKPRRQ